MTLRPQLDPARTAVRVRAGDGLLAFVGEVALWWLANTLAARRESIDRLLGAISQKSAAS